MKINDLEKLILSNSFEDAANENLVDIVDQNNETILIHLVKKKIIFSSGYLNSERVNHKCLKGRNLVMYMLKYDNLNLFDNALKFLNDPNQVDNHSFSILDYALLVDNSYFTKILNLKKVKFEKLNNQWPTIFNAIALGNYKAFIQLLNITKNINQQSSNQYTLLNYAIMRHRNDICKDLISHGADIYIEDSRKWNSIFYAAYFKNTEILDILKNKINKFFFKKKDLFNNSVDYYLNK